MTALIVLPATVLSDSKPVGDHTTDRGSDRGSGYWGSNPILRHCDNQRSNLSGSPAFGFRLR